MSQQKNLLNAILRKDFNAFLQKVFTELNPSETLQNARYLDAMTYQLMQCYHGRQPRLVINVPPRHLKSITVSVAFVAWVLGHRPSSKFICVSYEQKLSEFFSVQTRSIMESDWYQQVFPNARIEGDSNTKPFFKTTQGGYRLATSVGGKITGYGCDYLIIDDAHKADDALSDAQRMSTLNWYRHSASSRFNNPSKGVAIVVGQRLHQEDLPGWLVAEGGFAHLNLPAIAETEQKLMISDTHYILRKEGSLLNPKWQSMAFLMERKTTMGSIAFAAQYQQRPAPAEGAIVKMPWIKRYKKTPERLEGDLVVQSWDTALTAHDHSDPTVGITCLIRKERVYLLDVVRRKLEHPDVLRLIQQQRHDWHADFVLIEAVGGGLVLLQELRERGLNNIIPRKPKEDKPTRMRVETAMIEAGHLWMPAEAPWLSDFVSELLNFPNSKHDDQVDALSQLLRWHRQQEMSPPTLTCHVTVIGPPKDVLGLNSASWS